MNSLTVFPHRFRHFGLAAMLMVLAACTTVKPPEVVVQPEVPQVPAAKKIPKLGWPWAAVQRVGLPILG
jgi:hypothetical protein